jgi:hypothetical protein
MVDAIFLIVINLWLHLIWHSKQMHEHKYNIKFLKL